MAITHSPNKLPKVGAIVTSIKINDNCAGGDIADIEFIDSDCEGMDHGYVKHENRKHIAVHLRFERNALENEILNNYIYPKDATWQDGAKHTIADKLAEETKENRVKGIKSIIKTKKKKASHKKPQVFQ